MYSFFLIVFFVWADFVSGVLSAVVWSQFTVSSSRAAKLQCPFWRVVQGTVSMYVIGCLLLCFATAFCRGHQALFVLCCEERCVLIKEINKALLFNSVSKLSYTCCQKNKKIKQNNYNRRICFAWSQKYMYLRSVYT